MARVPIIVVFLGLAAAVALLSGHLIHSGLDVPSATIRYDAVAAAGFLTIICALDFMKK